MKRQTKQGIAQYEYRLSDLLQGVTIASVSEKQSTHSNTNLDLSSRLIRGLTLDSRKVEAGSLFVAMSGGHHHGLEFAALAEERGAVAIIWESDAHYCVPDYVNIPCFEINNLRKYLGVIANRFYAEPSQALDIMGVTGTNGKTTVTHFIAQAFNGNGVNGINGIPHATEQAKTAAVIGTLGIGLPNAVQETGHTTPDVLSVHQALATLKQQGIKHVAMEVSSHALDQERVNDVAFDVVVLTNLTRDHLDYHQTVVAYAAAKAKLFAWPTAKTLVLNVDDEFGVMLANEQAERAQAEGVNIIGYGVGNPADYPRGSLVASKPRYTIQGIQAEVHFVEERNANDRANECAQLSAPVLGAFNLYNLLAVVGALIGFGIPFKEAVARLASVDTVAGRMEMVVNDQGMLVVVDYAHTPDALEQALQAIRKHTAGRLICVFGCGGDRDRGKRPLMAGIAEQSADMVILTDDNPRNESPFQIMQEMKSGLKNPQHVVIEHNRSKAIHFAVQAATAGDTILIAGKGHETVQIVCDETHQFDDRKQAAKALLTQKQRQGQGN